MKRGISDDHCLPAHQQKFQPIGRAPSLDASNSKQNWNPVMQPHAPAKRSRLGLAVPDSQTDELEYGGIEYAPYSPSSVEQEYAVTPKTGRWTKHEDELLRQAVTDYGPKSWKRISEAAFDARRSDVQCLHRWQKVLKPGLKKGQWTEEEDNRVRQEVRKMGGAVNVKWSAVALHLTGRLGKQVRERWQNHLDPCLIKDPWRSEEDQLLISLQAVMGNRWSEIARAFPGRSENSVKNRWNSKQRKNLAMERKRRTGSELGIRCKPLSAYPKSEDGANHEFDDQGECGIQINFSAALEAARSDEPHRHAHRNSNTGLEGQLNMRDAGRLLLDIKATLPGTKTLPLESTTNRHGARR